jgi:hypothetical protein
MIAKEDWSKFYDLCNSFHTDEELRLYVVSELRRIADHLETGNFPLIYFAKLPNPNLNAELMTDIHIVLSHPWPG